MPAKKAAAGAPGRLLVMVVAERGELRGGYMAEFARCVKSEFGETRSRVYDHPRPHDRTIPRQV
jgi:hypothetical protein